MLKRNILVGFLFLFSLNVSANEAALAKEAKKYKTFKELCIKSKQWSVLGKSVPFAIKWKSKCEFMRMGEHLQKSKDRYYALSPYVFANMKPGNVFFKVDGFTDYTYTNRKNGGYSIGLSNGDLKKSELGKLYAHFDKKYKKIDFKSKKENRSSGDVRKRIKMFHKMVKTSASDYDEELRNAVAEVATWNHTTYMYNKDKIVVSVTTIASSIKEDISAHITYIVK